MSATDASPPPSTAEATDGGELSHLVSPKGAADAMVTAPWSKLAQRVACALVSADDDSEAEETEAEDEAAHGLGLSRALVATPLPRGRARARAEREARPWRSVAHRMASALANTGDGPWEDFSMPLTPAPLGAKLCPCEGEVLVMCGHYGWLRTSYEVDHPAAARHGGRIYVHSRDIVDTASLVEGDRVQFYLYVDEDGLGAEEVSLQRGDGGRCAPGMNPCAPEFVPACSMSVSACRAPQLDRFVLNSAYWSDDSDTDSGAECEMDGHGDLHSGHKKSRAGSRSSASTGSPSDSEAQDSPPPGLFHPDFKLPPGLSPPLSLPPGLGS